MHPIVRSVIGGLVGVLVAFALVAGIEAVGHLVYPVPPGVDFGNAQALEAYVAEQPVGALAFVVAAWVIATFVGGAIAAIVAGRHAVLMAGLVGGAVLAATAANFAMIPHPSWMVVTGIVGIMAAARLAGTVVAGGQRTGG